MDQVLPGTPARHRRRAIFIYCFLCWIFFCTPLARGDDSERLENNLDSYKSINTHFQRLPSVEGSAHKLPQPQLLATPKVRSYMGYNRRVLKLKDGRTLGVLSYSQTCGSTLYLIDSDTLAIQQYDVPNDDIGTHGSAVGDDGNIYLCPYHNGYIWKFDTNTKTFAKIETDIPESEYTWSALAASNGRIYFGTYPNAYFGEFDPATNKTRYWAHAAEQARYLSNLMELPDGTIRARAWGPGEASVVFDPSTGRITHFQVEDSDIKALDTDWPLPRGELAAGKLETPDSKRFIITKPSGRLWELLDNNKLALRGETHVLDNWLLTDMNGVIIGISFQGNLFRYDPDNTDLRSSQLPNEVAGGSKLMFLETLGPRCVVGGHYSQQTLFFLDPTTGEVNHLFKCISLSPGEPYCAIGFRGIAYLGIYVGAELLMYDPDKVYSWGSNPRVIGRLGDEGVVRPRAAATDGKQLFFTIDSDYNKIGGILVTVNPLSNDIETIVRPLIDQDLPSLAYDPATGYLWGGTHRWGQMRSHPPTQPSALIYAYDTEQESTVAVLEPWPGADQIDVIGVSKTGLLVAAMDNELALIDTKQARVLCRGPSPVTFVRHEGIPPRLILGSDGNLYGLADDRMYRWDMSDNTLTPIAEVPDGWHLTEYAPHRWLITDAANIYTVSSDSDSLRTINDSNQ